MSQRQNRRALWFGGECGVPPTLATCPECGATLLARAMQWEQATGRPASQAIELYCQNEFNNARIAMHGWTQDKWQPVRDAVAAWCGASMD